MKWARQETTIFPTDAVDFRHNLKDSNTIPTEEIVAAQNNPTLPLNFSNERKVSDNFPTFFRQPK